MNHKRTMLLLAVAIAIVACSLSVISQKENNEKLISGIITVDPFLVGDSDDALCFGSLNAIRGPGDISLFIIGDTFAIPQDWFSFLFGVGLGLWLGNTTFGGGALLLETGIVGGFGGFITWSEQLYLTTSIAITARNELQFRLHVEVPWEEARVEGRIEALTSSTASLMSFDGNAIWKVGEFCRIPIALSFKLGGIAAFRDNYYCQDYWQVGGKAALRLTELGSGAHANLELFVVFTSIWTIETAVSLSLHLPIIPNHQEGGP